MKNLISTAAAVFTLLTLTPALAHAQTSPFEVDESQRHEIAERTQLVKITTDANGVKTFEPMEDEDGLVVTRGLTDDLDVQFTGSVSYNSIQSANVSFGVIIGQAHGTWSDNTLQGVLVEFRPGLGGAMTSVGYMIRNNLLAILTTSLAAKMDVYQTWSKTNDILPGQTYIGASANLKFLLLDLSLGVLKHVAGDQNNANWRVYLGMGVGI